MMQRSTLISILLSLGILAILVGMVFYVRENLGLSPAETPTPSPTTTVAASSLPTPSVSSTPEPCVISSGYKYELRRNGPFYDDPLFWQQKLVRIDLKTCTEEILAANVQGATPHPLSRGRSLNIYAVPANTQRIYFMSVLDGTDAPPAGFLAFDLPTRKFIELELGGFFHGYGTIRLSPDSKMIAGALFQAYGDKIQKLYLLDMEKDTGSIIVTLTGNETLVMSEGEGPGGPYANLKWIDNNTIEYGVYDMAHTLLGLRRVDIQRKP